MQKPEHQHFWERVAMRRKITRRHQQREKKRHEAFLVEVESYALRPRYELLKRQDQHREDRPLPRDVAPPTGRKTNGWRAI
jgi:hypothetical protein